MTTMTTDVQAQTPGKYYVHSGKAPFAGVVGGVVVGLVCAVLGAIAYAYAVIYIPLIYARVVLGIGFGAMLGYVPGRVMQKASVRNAAVIIAIALGVALAGFYLSWISWIYVLFSRSRFHAHPLLMVERPAVLWRVISVINKHGTWSLGHDFDSSTSSDSALINGLALWVVWAAEAACILISAWWGAVRIARRAPFCERCQRWCSGLRLIRRTAPSDAADIKRRLEAGDMDFVPALPGYPTDIGRYFQWYYNQCPSCKEFNTLTVTDITATRNKKGRMSRKKRVLVPQLIVNALQLERLMPLAVVPAPAEGAIASPGGTPPFVAGRAAPLSPVPVTVKTAPMITSPASPPPAIATAPMQPPVFTPSPPAPAPSDDQLLDL